jgi:hypothetical protein
VLDQARRFKGRDLIEAHARRFFDFGRDGLGEWRQAGMACGLARVGASGGSIFEAVMEDVAAAAGWDLAQSSSAIRRRNSPKKMATPFIP